MLFRSSQLIDEGFDKGWAECREKMLADFSIHFPNSDLNLIDTDKETPEALHGGLLSSIPSEQLGTDASLSRFEAEASDPVPASVDPSRPDPPSN